MPVAVRVAVLITETGILAKPLIGEALKMLGAFAVVILYALLGVGEVLLWEERKLRSVVTEVLMGWSAS